MKRTRAAATIVVIALSSPTVLVSADAATTTAHAASARAGSYTVDARVNRTEPLQGAKVTIKAKITPAAPGAAVTLQLKYADQKTWKTIGHGRLNGRSKVTFKDKVSSVRERRYRVVKPADAQVGAGHGTTAKVSVFGWRDLTSLGPATAVNMAETLSVDFGGVRYPRSIRSYYFGLQSPTVSIDYNLNRDCKSFRGTVGLDDSSPAAGTALVALATDGTQRYAGQFGLTQSAPVAFDVTQVFRLTIGAANSNGGVGAVGTPQVLCSF